MKEMKDILKSVETITEHIDAISERRKTIERQLRKVREESLVWAKRKREKIQELDYLSPFQVGDKVLVKGCIRSGNSYNPVWNDKKGIISKVLIRIRGDKSLEFEYKVNSIKKDGTMSSKAIRRKLETYSKEQIEKLQ